jgi:glucokinase
MNIIGIDIGGTKILGIRTDEYGMVLEQVRHPTGASDGLEAVLVRIVDMIRELTPPEGVDAIGIGVPGPLNPMKGEVYNPPNLPGWDTVPLCKIVQERLQLPEDVPVALVNDANAAALAEFKFGAGANKGIKHLVYFTISTGIGGGVITNGKLLLGASGMASELGHIVLDVNGPECGCGRYGHFEALASGTALAKEAARLVQDRRDTSLVDMVGGDPSEVKAEMVVQAAQDGDRVARQLMEREGLLVAAGVVTAIHTFNPEIIVLGGGVTNAGDLLFDTVRTAVDAGVMPAYRGTYEIVPAALGDISGALGAVAAALDEL